MDDEPIGIDADAPEADWIEQHQPVSDDDEDLFPVAIPEDVPEADALDQARGFPEDDSAFADDPDLVESSSTLDDETDFDDFDDFDGPGDPHDAGEREPDALRSSRATTPARGCNPIGVLVELVTRIAGR